MIYTSGYTDSAIFRNEMIDEKSAFLQKPISPKRLMSKLRTVLVGKD